MEDNSENVSYILSYHASTQAHETAFVFVVSLLRKCFSALEIIVVEQGSVPSLELAPQLDIKHIFLKNDLAPNHSLANNKGAIASTRQNLVFGTSELFLSHEDFTYCTKALDSFDVILPNCEKLILVEEENIDKAIFSVKSHRDSNENEFLFISKDAFEKIGGWDERFSDFENGLQALTHVIFNKLSSHRVSLPMYSMTNQEGRDVDANQSKPESQNLLLNEIKTKFGSALHRYIYKLQLENGFQKDSTTVERKPPNFVLAVTTFNRLDYLKKCLDSFFQTRTPEANWQIIVADDGSTDGTGEYLKNLESEHDAIILQNKGGDIHRQLNSILRQLRQLDYNLCFRCDDDVHFLQQGWDELYWQTMKRTGFDHLIFYDSNWRPANNLSEPIEAGTLVSRCAPDAIQGGFYTLTPKLLEVVGYFDEQNFGRRGLGHVDFSFRCCRAGFNVLSSPFDIKESNKYIRLQAVDSYQGSVTSHYKARINPPETIAYKKRLLKMSRIFIPYNQNDVHPKVSFTKNARHKNSKKGNQITTYHRADAAFYPNRGIKGFVGFLLKNIYNFGIDTRLYFIPKTIKSCGRFLNKLSLDLLGVDE